MRIVLVEDNEMLARGIANALRDLGHAVDCIPNGLEGASFLSAGHGADLAIIDLNLPGMNGIEIIRAMRARGDATPVLMLTARGETADRVAGLDAGADDYVVKPFVMAELVARLRALRRRSPGLAPQVERLGQLEFDRAARRLVAAGRPIELPRRELALFEVLLDNAGRVVPKDRIGERLYGTGSEIEPNAVELLVSRLRRKLAGCGVEIRTARGLGYMLDAGGGGP
jgi:two-component system, OmpR family, response regulator